jgi:prepilin-type processing-associated H-X9-DG protein
MMHAENPAHSVQEESPRPRGNSCSATCGLLGLLFGIGLSTGLYFLIQPAFESARDEAQKVRCANHLKIIGLACLLYADENGGRLPPDLAVLTATKRIDNAATLYCPVSDEPYAYRKELGATPFEEFDAPGKTVLAYDAQPAHDGGNVLFLDGHVEHFPAGKFRARIEGETTPEPPPSAK